MSTATAAMPSATSPSPQTFTSATFSKKPNGHCPLHCEREGLSLLYRSRRDEQAETACLGERLVVVLAATSPRSSRRNQPGVDGGPRESRLRPASRLPDHLVPD